MRLIGSFNLNKNAFSTWNSWHLHREWMGCLHLWCLQMAARVMWDMCKCYGNIFNLKNIHTYRIYKITIFSLTLEDQSPNDTGAASCGALRSWVTRRTPSHRIFPTTTCHLPRTYRLSLRIRYEHHINHWLKSAWNIFYFIFRWLNYLITIE